MKGAHLAIEELRKAIRILDRAEDIRTVESNFDSAGTTPLNWAFSIGAARFSLVMALGALGDFSLLDARQAALSAELAALTSTSSKANP